MLKLVQCNAATRVALSKPPYKSEEEIARPIKLFWNWFLVAADGINVD